MKPSLRVVGVGLVVSLFSVAPAFAAKVVIEMDKTCPSGGSQAPVIWSGGGSFTVDLANADPGPTPLAKIDETSPLTPTPTLVFTGVTQAPSGDAAGGVGFIYKPPDTHHATGLGAGALGRIVEVTNSGIQIFNKTGASVAGPLDLDLFLTALLVPGMSPAGVPNFAFDPKVLYDQASGRFFVVILDGNTPARSNVHICTSITSTPSTLTLADWTVESATAITVLTAGPCWFDYPGIGADATRLGITGNMFTGANAFGGMKIRMFDKSTLTDNVPGTAVFNDINVDGAGFGSTVQPAHVFGTTTNGDFYLINRFGATTYALWQVTGLPPAAALVPGSPTANAWTAGAQLLTGAPQISDGLNTNPTISLVSARVQNAVYRSGAIWLALTSDAVVVDGGAAEVTWFQINPNTGASIVPGVLTSAAVVQAGAIDGSTGTDWAYMPSISVNVSGDAVITFTESNATKAAEMRVAARFVTDAVGTFQASVVVATGAGEYDDFGADNPERWGDYCGTTVDPDDDETFWVSSEVCQTATTPAGSDARWGTRIAQLGAVVPVELSRFVIE